MSKKRQIGLIDLETGELINMLEENDKIVKGKTIQFLKKESKKITIPIKNYSRINSDELDLLCKELNRNEKSILFLLIVYLSYNDNSLKHENGYPLTIDNIIKLSGYNERLTKSIVKGLCDKLLIVYNKKEYIYYLNPWIANRGKKLDPSLLDMFGSYPVRSFDGKSWYDLEYHNSDNNG